MPRVQLNAKKYRINDLEDYIRGEMKRQKITQTVMASKIGMSQQVYSSHLNKMDFDVPALIGIFETLGTDSDKIGRLLKV